MRRDYVTSGTAVVVLLCACVVAMAADDVNDSSSSSSSSRHDTLAKIVQELRHVAQANKQLRSDVQSLVSDYAELERRLGRETRPSLVTGHTRQRNVILSETRESMI